MNQSAVVVACRRLKEVIAQQRGRLRRDASGASLVCSRASPQALYCYLNLWGGFNDG
jgi:hypothetical protein